MKNIVSSKQVPSSSSSPVSPIPGVSHEAAIDHHIHVLPKPVDKSYPTVIWEWQQDGEWREYDERQRNRIEHAYEMGCRHLRLKSSRLGHSPMEIFFKDMIQFEPATGSSKSIRRTGPDHLLMRMRRKLLGMFQQHVNTWNSVSQNVTFEQFKAYAAVRAGTKMTPELREHLLATEKKSDLFAATYMAHIVKSHQFEMLQMMLILVNVAWLGYETDHDAKPTLTEEPFWFQCMTHSWCILFLCESLVRIVAYKSVKHAFKDIWFVFDASLVLMMIVETWVMPAFASALGIKNLAVLRLMRLLRLTRIGRVTRILRLLPEVMTLLKGIGACLRSVFFTLVLLLNFLFVFGIVFKTQIESTELQDDFGTLKEAMWTLLVTGVFLDEFTVVVDRLRQHEPFFAGLFLIFVFLASFTVLNMLIGIICEVASLVSANEKEQAAIHHLKSTLLNLIECFDKDDDRHIVRDDFEFILRNPEVCMILSEFGVNVTDLISLKDYLFEERDVYRCENSEESNASSPDSKDRSEPQVHSKKWRKISFGEFLSVVMRLRGSNRSTVMDIVDLREHLNERLGTIENKVREVMVVNKIIESKHSHSPSIHGRTHDDAKQSTSEKQAMATAVFEQTHAATVMPVASVTPLPGIIPIGKATGNEAARTPLGAQNSSSQQATAFLSDDAWDGMDMRQMLLEMRKEMHQQLAVLHQGQTQIREVHESMSKEIQQIRQQQQIPVKERFGHIELVRQHDYRIPYDPFSPSSEAENLN